jgi:hypothetical protein
MIGPFRIHIPRLSIPLDFDGLTTPVKDILFDGLVFRADIHQIIRLPIAFLPDISFRGPARIRRKKSFDKVTQLYFQVSLPSPDFEILAVYPHTTMAPGQNDPQLDFGISVDPFTGKFTLSGTLKNLIRRKRHLILNTHTAEIAQWTFEKAYLRDHLQLNLDILLRQRNASPAESHLTCEAKAQQGGRLIRATRKRVSIQGQGA